MNSGFLLWWWRALTLGLKRRLTRGGSSALSALGAVWLVTEIATRVSTDAKDYFDAHHQAYLGCIAIIAILAFLRAVWEPSSVRFRVPTTSTHVTLRYGDFFAGDADLLLAVNEFFDHSLGTLVDQSSLHGQLILGEFQGDLQRFRASVDAALAGVPGEAVHRPNLPSTRYPIGTTANLQLGARQAFLVALTHTDLATGKASTTVHEFWAAMAAAWQAVHDRNNGRPLALPLIGNGRASINLQPQHLLRLLVLSLVDYARRLRLPDEIAIVPPLGCFEHLDLREIARDWSH
ncbi:hypothetical protein H7F51_09080 [Novosphingobium flavum]|uniref:Thoeris protein ThsA Macro domain-containing protein n=1 Tax=Novosphingobium flavum TaxID=1778672 RepID=A0A7X1FRL2_9SPHN|nr:macro domain-containing protein [Novosphingobium flavum]MBC2665676.1 hypothetical protein [Novosphingobium flavum]